MSKIYKLDDWTTDCNDFEEDDILVDYDGTEYKITGTIADNDYFHVKGVKDKINYEMNFCDVQEGRKGAFRELCY